MCPQPKSSEVDRPGAPEDVEYLLEKEDPSKLRGDGCDRDRGEEGKGRGWSRDRRSSNDRRRPETVALRVCLCVCARGPVVPWRRRRRKERREGRDGGENFSRRSGKEKKAGNTHARKT